MTYRYIYKITCLTGSWKGKFSFGQHTTDNLNDGYFSSSILICNYKKKYGLKNCKREIISFHNTQEELNQAEYDIIHPWLGNEMCLNLCEGGKGGPMFKGHKHTEESKNKTSASLYKYYETHEGVFTGHHHSVETKQQMSKNRKGHPSWNKGLPKEKQPMYGKHNTEESKEKNRLAHLGKKCSEETKQKFREATSKKRWLTKENENPIYIDVDKVEYYLSLGYHRGRK